MFSRAFLKIMTFNQVMDLIEVPKSNNSYLVLHTYVLDLLSPPLRHPIPYGTLFRISHRFFSMYYLLSGSNGFFLSLTCISEEKSSFAAEDDILALLLRFC